MKTMEAVQTQTVQARKVMPQTSLQAQKLLAVAKATAGTSTKDANNAKAVTAVKEVKPKVEKARAESMEALGSRLLKEKADDKAIQSAFVKAYKVKGITDTAFIEKRVKIYMHIAEKRATAKK
jgi:hypothetical protein